MYNHFSLSHVGSNFRLLLGEEILCAQIPKKLLCIIFRGGEYKFVYLFHLIEDNGKWPASCYLGRKANSVNGVAGLPDVKSEWV